MGMFDRVRCRYPLPDVEAQDLEFQSKSMLQVGMASYEVTPDGRLVLLEAGLLEPSPASSTSAATDSEPIIGKPVDYRGQLEIHTSAEQPDGQLRWYSYLLWFREGQVSDIQRGTDCGRMLVLRQTPTSPETPPDPEAGVEV